MCNKVRTQVQSSQQSFTSIVEIETVEEAWHRISMLLRMRMRVINFQYERIIKLQKDTVELKKHTTIEIALKLPTNKCI